MISKAFFQFYLVPEVQLVLGPVRKSDPIFICMSRNMFVNTVFVDGERGLGRG